MRRVIFCHLMTLLIGVAVVHGGETGIVQKEVSGGRDADHALQDKPALPELRLTFATLATSEKQAIQVARSIRHSGGAFAHCPVWIFFCERMSILTPSTQQQLEDLKISVIRFRPDLCVDRVPYALKVCAAACAEAMAEHCSELLWWIDREPRGMAAASMENRTGEPLKRNSPGDLSTDEELDRIIRTGCPILDARLKSTRDILTIRSYLESGSLVVRPENGLLRQWREILKQLEEGPPNVPVPDERNDSEFLARL
jgi:hypothetical protein